MSLITSMDEGRRADARDWRWPLDVTTYDCHPVLAAAEGRELACLFGRDGRAPAGLWERTALTRLVQPLEDACRAMHISAHQRRRTMRVVLHEIWRRGSPVWAWSETEWVETIGPTMPAFLARHGSNAHVTRQPILGIAYLLAGFTAFDRFRPHSVELTTLARTIFGPARMAAALERVMAALVAWGYRPSISGRLHTALAYALLRTRSPDLVDLTREHLVTWYTAPSRAAAPSALAHLYPLSRALAHLHLIAAPVPRPGASAWAHALPDRLDTAGVAPEWASWCCAWYERAVLSPTAKRQSLYALLQIGRWLARTHPEVTNPAQWDYDVVADFVAAVDRMTVGAWGSPSAAARPAHAPAEKPIMPRTKAGLLCRARRFFLDLQEVPHRIAPEGEAYVLPRRFDPRRALRTPRAIRALIGPDPRVIDDRWWLKLLHAAETLERSDLGKWQVAMYPIELVRAVAATWCLSGLRTDEIRRLRVGCVRGRAGDRPDEDGVAPNPSLPDDAVCVLSVPVNKTGTAFAKPVHALVGRRIAEWERVRPAQPPALDPKTNEVVDFLFSVRRRRVGAAYINLRLIPILCRKANLPPLDARGRITAHRARITLASALYNAPDGLTIDELGEWLGHHDLRSTRHYAKIEPTRLVKAVARANKNARLVQVLLDPAAAARGEPALFYYLGAGSYCANPAWASCPHRMACLKCPMYVPKDAGARIEARAGITRLLQEVPLTTDEQAVATGDAAALARYIEQRRDVSPPAVPDARYVFNTADRPSTPRPRWNGSALRPDST